MANIIEEEKKTFTFPKKLLMPLVEKYSINVEKNKRFQQIVEMFRDRQNYVVWAVKAFFEKNITITGLEKINEWILKNQHLIKFLSKENIVAYKTKEDIDQLKSEIKNLDKIHMVKKIIETFNTDQRGMLANISHIDDVNSMSVEDENFKMVYNLFVKFNKLIDGVKENFIKRVSSIRDEQALLANLKRVVGKNFEWGKEFLLDFIKRYCPTTEIIVNKDNILIVKVHTFNETKLLGNRTSWCIASQLMYFNRYVIEPGEDKVSQFILFDFNQVDLTELSMIGFTIQQGKGVSAAHDCKNNGCTDDAGYSYNGVKTSISEILRNNNVTGKDLILIKCHTKYTWDKEAFVDFIHKSYAKDDYKVVFEDDNRMLLLVDNSHVIQQTVNNTMNKAVGKSDFWNKPSDERTYMFVDFTKEYNDNDAVICFNVCQNEYGIESVRISSDTYGNKLPSVSEYMNSIGVSDDLFIIQKEANPSMVLHSAVNENNLSDVNKCIEQYGDVLNVNHEFNDKTPVHMAIQNNNLEMLKVLVSHPSFDISVIDAFGDTVFSNVIYKIRNTHKDSYVDMMKYLLTLDLDFNIKNINNDTALILACQKEETLWIAEELLKKENLDLNVINDNNDTALSEAIKGKFVTMIDTLVRDSRIEIRECDETGLMACDSLPVSTKEFVKNGGEVEEEKPKEEKVAVSSYSSKYDGVLTNEFLKKALYD